MYELEEITHIREPSAAKSNTILKKRKVRSQRSQCSRAPDLRICDVRRIEYARLRIFIGSRMDEERKIGRCGGRWGGEEGRRGAERPTRRNTIYHTYTLLQIDKKNSGMASLERPYAVQCVHVSRSARVFVLCSCALARRIAESFPRFVQATLARPIILSVNVCVCV